MRIAEQEISHMSENTGLMFLTTCKVAPQDACFTWRHNKQKGIGTL